MPAGTAGSGPGLAARLGVVIATRDRREDLLEVLPRLLALPDPPRVVVVDNGSSDGTPAAVSERFGGRGVEVIALGENRGAAARTVGAERLDVPYVAWADDDSWWAPGALERAVELLDRHPRVGLVAARVLVGPEQRLDPVCSEMAASPLRRATGTPGPRVLGFVACGAVVRREAFLEVGGFEGRFGIGGEEALLALDLAAAGWSCCYCPEVVAHHHPSPTRDPQRRRAVETRNALWTSWMRRRPVTAAGHTLDVARRTGSDAGARAGLLEAARSAPWALARRRSVPSDVEDDARELEG